MNFALSERNTFAVLLPEPFRVPPAHTRLTWNFTPLRSQDLRPMSSPSLQTPTSLYETSMLTHEMRPCAQEMTRPSHEMRLPPHSEVELPNPRRFHHRTTKYTHKMRPRLWRLRTTCLLGPFARLIAVLYALLVP